MSRRVQILAVAAVLLAAGVARAGRYKNDRWGYQIVVPSGWIEAAMSANEEWIASKHMDKRRLEAKGVFWAAENPQIWVIGFPHARQDERGAKIETEKGKTKITAKNPYKDYKDYLRENKWFVGGGYHFTQEEETEIGGVKVTQYEIVVDKMVQAPFRIKTWVYHFDDIDFAIHCKVLEDYFDKYKASFRKTLKSFKRIERKKALPGSATTGNRITEIEDESKLTPEEKAQRRQEDYNRTLQKEIDALPDGWSVMKSKNYVALTNTDKKFTKRALEHAEGVRKYLEKHFGDVGSDYVPPGILRVFNSDAELMAYFQGTGISWIGGFPQVLTAKATGAVSRSWAFESISWSLTTQYLSFKNRHLSNNMPWWFERGLAKHMEFARVKGKRVEIKPDEYDRQIIKDMIKEEKAIPIKTLFEKGDDEQSWSYQCGSVITYLMGKGNRGKTKNIVHDYIANLIKAIDEAEAEFEKAKEKAKKAREANSGEIIEETEDESGVDDGTDPDAQLKAALKKKRKDIRENAFTATFGHMTDSDWEKLDRAWQGYAG